MRAQVIIPVIVSILILTVISLIPSSYAQVLFSDNFDDGDISEYQQFGGTWTTVSEPGRGDVLRHTSNSNTVIFPQSESFSNSYQVIAEIWNEDNDAVGVAFGINPADPDNLYSCSASADSAFNSGIWEHVNDVNGPPINQLATQSWNYKRSTWYTVTITVDQNTNTINCTWESQAGVELDVTATIPNPTPSGSVGIWLSHQDNFKGDLLEVRSLGPPDTEFPQLSVQDPQNITYEISEVPLNYVASDNVGLSACSYDLDGNTTPLPNCQNTILSSLTLSPPSHSITVSATDTSGNTSTSPVITFFVNKDTSPPQWNPDPENIVLLEGQPLFYDADATDNNSAVSFSISDEIKFKIGLSTGILENNINPLPVGTYPLTLFATDGDANVNSVSISIIIQAVGVTPPGYKVAFIADQGSGSTATAVLNVILNEGADMVMHQGDFDYSDDPDAWDAKITSVLGPDFPYFASVGNHDDGSAVWPAYQQKLTDRLALIDGAVCTFGSGGIGVKQSCTYNGLFFVLSGVGTLESNHATYIQNEMANDNSIWRICSWHKNMNAMQLGTKGDSTGWEVYEECRAAGAIIATGHEHTYSRTRTLSSVQNQIVDPAWPDTNNVRVGEGSTFVFVAGLGGAGMRDQNRCLPFTFPYGCNGEWASIYTTDQNSKHGALFCSFNVGGQANKAHCYFKDIDGNIPDQFDVTSFNSVPAGSPPVLEPIGGQTVNEGAPLAFTATATDSDIPPDILTFSLSGEPAGASITSGGDFTWTPTEAQGPNTYMFDVIVSDGSLTDSETITVTVDEVNAAPILTSIGSKTVDEEVPLAFTATATDSDIPANTLTFSLSGAVPAGASITSAGVFTWTPTEAQGPGTYMFDVVVTDDGSPVLSHSETIIVTVNEANAAPVLASIGSKMIDEEAPLAFAATATDSDAGQTRTFSLSGEPAGASITSGGDFTWTPTEAQGPGPHTFDVIVTDDGSPALSDSETIIVTVDEVNVAPVLDGIGDKTIVELTTLSFSATATDSDIPANTLTFSLSGEPAGASITSGGDFTWTPTEAQGPGPHTFDVKVTDDGSPALSDLETIIVTVNPANETHVKSIELTAKVKGKSTKSQIFTSVTIFDANVDGNPVPGAQVTIKLTGFNAGVIDTATTDSNGIATFTFSSAKAGNTYTSTVTNVSKSGFTYVPPSIPSNSITI